MCKTPREPDYHALDHDQALDLACGHLGRNERVPQLLIDRLSTLGFDPGLFADDIFEDDDDAEPPPYR